MVDPSHAVFPFTAISNLDYTAQYRNALGAGGWAALKDFASAPGSRLLRLTNAVGGAPSRFFRLVVGP